MKSTQDKQSVVFENVWQQDPSAIREEVLRIWSQAGGPTGDRAIERLKQVVFVVRNAEGSVVGISTAFKVYVKQLRNYFYAVRLMLIPDYRIPGLTSKLLVLTRDYLELIHTRDTTDRAIGLITLVENQRIKENLNEAVWPASGMVYIGNSPEGHHIRVYYFKGARITP